MFCLARRPAVALLALAAGVLLCAAEVDNKKKHHHHKHHRHHHHHKHDGHSKHGAPSNATAAAALQSNASRPTALAHQAGPGPESNTSDRLIIGKMRELEKDLSSKGRLEDLTLQRAQLKVNAPLPADFGSIFARGISLATGCKQAEVRVLSTMLLPQGSVDQVTFEAPRFAAREAERQAADPDSKLARGPLRLLLMAKDDDGEGEEGAKQEEAQDGKKGAEDKAAPAPAAAAAPTAAEPSSAAMSEEDAEPPAGGIDIDAEMPFGDLEPFGREDTAQELTESAIGESNRMVDQLERAEVAEEKRAVFRALTRLRGAAIASFDGVARTQTGNIDEYNKLHKWRSAHPLHHLAEEEADISKWAFPEEDF